MKKLQIYILVWLLAIMADSIRVDLYPTKYKSANFECYVDSSGTTYLKLVPLADKQEFEKLLYNIEVFFEYFKIYK